MGSGMINDLENSIELRTDAAEAKLNIELARKRFGVLGAAVVGLLHLKQTRIKHHLH